MESFFVKPEIMTFPNKKMPKIANKSQEKP